MMHDWYEEEMMRERKYYDRQDKGGQLSYNAWRFNDHGAVEPQQSSFANIYAAVRDWEDSRQWN